MDAWHEYLRKEELKKTAQFNTDWSKAKRPSQNSMARLRLRSHSCQFGLFSSKFTPNIRSIDLALKLFYCDLDSLFHAERDLQVSYSKRYLLIFRYLIQNEKFGFIVPLTKVFVSLIFTYVLTLSAKIIKNGTSEKSRDSKSGKNTGRSRSKWNVWSPY